MEENKDIYLKVFLMIIFIVLLLFTWYYVTLPGSVLSPNEKHPKPALKTALTSYLIYTLPMVLLVYYLDSKQNKFTQIQMSMFS